MPKKLLRPGYVGAFFASLILSLSTGCLSGTYKLTTEYSSFVNRQQIVLRVVLYILTFVVFGVTLVIDGVINNTIEFWTQQAAPIGDYRFQQNDKIYLVRHERIAGKKRSTIRILDEHQKQLKEIVLNETKDGDIEMYVDGRLRTKVRNISEIPFATNFDENGRIVGQELILPNSTVAQAR